METLLAQKVLALDQAQDELAEARGQVSLCRGMQKRTKNELKLKVIPLP